MTMKRLLPTLLLLCWYALSTPALAQQTGEVSFPEYGLSFTIPDGWAGQVMGEAFLIGHQTQPGFLMLTANEARSLEQMRQEASQGMNDPANGLFLQPEGTLESIGDHGLGGAFSGSMGGQPVKSYLVGLINPHGQGVLVMSAVAAPQWSAQYRELALQLAGSVRFSKVEKAPVAAQGGSVAEWKHRLGNTRLTFMESYNSIDYSNPDVTIGGGYSRKEVIDLCVQGYFNYASNNSMSVTGGANVSGNAYGNSKGAGKWDIREEPNGNKTLVLSFHSGESYEYVLSYLEEKMHLNGDRYYHTWTGENAPNCP